MLLGTVDRATRDIGRDLANFDPERISSEDAAKLFGALVVLERAIMGAKTLVASRAADSGIWRDQGHRSPASWVAETTGTGLGEAIGVLETAERLVSLPETTEALRRGELSAPQLKEIAATAVENPSTEGELLEAAARSGLKGLMDHCRRVKARAIGETKARARYEQIRRNRSLVIWTDHDGVGRVEARLTPDAMARFTTAIRNESDAIFEEARKAGHREQTVAYDADALVALVTGSSVSGTSGTGTAVTGTSANGTRRRGRAGAGRSTTMLHLRVDLAALRRGSLDEGEICEIPGVGPVPLATAVNELGDAILKVIVKDGVDVTTVCHVGRTVPAHIRSALEDRDEKCVVPGCDVAKGLEIDHYKVRFEHDGPTELWNLCRLCRWHHYLKTHCGYALFGEPGSWEWNAPADERNPVLIS